QVGRGLLRCGRAADDALQIGVRHLPQEAQRLGLLGLLHQGLLRLAEGAAFDLFDGTQSVAGWCGRVECDLTPHPGREDVTPIALGVAEGCHAPRASRPRARRTESATDHNPTTRPDAAQIAARRCGCQPTEWLNGVTRSRLARFEHASACFRIACLYEQGACIGLLAAS